MKNMKFFLFFLHALYGVILAHYMTKATPVASVTFSADFFQLFKNN